MIPKLLEKKNKTILLNFGPQHPAAHGILKISLALSGEVILRADSQFGLLHRGSEKLCESRALTQIIPYVDRMDYVANLFQEHTIVLSMERSSKLLNKYPTKIVLDFRIIFDEFSRILNHLLTMSAVCLDLGAMGPIFWAFEEREQIMELYERLSGARMHTALYKPFFINSDLYFNFLLKDILFILQRGSRFISGAFLGLLNNKALKSRLSNVGSFSSKKLKTYGVTGILARASGLTIDLRLGFGGDNYSSYNCLNFRSFFGKKGDCYDRFLVRSKEILESFRIISQLLNNINNKKTNKRSKFISMETTINHFKNTISFNSTFSGISWSVVEGPKGAVGSVLVCNGSLSLSRLHIKSPVSHNLHLINTASRFSTFGDFVATFCSLDVVLGEIDR